MRAPIYLDHAATTPVDPRVAQAMTPFLAERFGNAASHTHAFGRDAADAIARARRDVAALVGCDAKDIVFTSGATESINLALKGTARACAAKGRHLVTLATEHKATLDTMRELEREGFEVTYVDVGTDGLVDVERFAAALRKSTTLASVMYVQNEIGVVQDVAAIGAACRERGILLHVDAAQATGKVPVDLATLPVDLMSLTAHKTYGPKGIGALFVRREPPLPIEAQMHGGGHERGLRSGTLATHQIVGMGEAYRLAEREMETDNCRIGALRDRLLAGLSRIERVYVNGDLAQRIPHNLNASFDGVDGEALLLALDDIALSSGSACTSASGEPSYVLRALGRSDTLASASIRFTLGRFTTGEEIDYTIERATREVERLREQSARDGVEEAGPTAPWLLGLPSALRASGLVRPRGGPSGSRPHRRPRRA